MLQFWLSPFYTTLFLLTQPPFLHKAQITIIFIYVTSYFYIMNDDLNLKMGITWKHLDRLLYRHDQMITAEKHMIRTLSGLFCDADTSSGLPMTKMLAYRNLISNIYAFMESVGQSFIDYINDETKNKTTYTENDYIELISNINDKSKYDYDKALKLAMTLNRWSTKYGPFATLTQSIDPLEAE